MEEILRYYELARSTSSAAFAAQLDSLYFLKRPSKRAAATAAKLAIGYATQLTKLDIDPYAKEWRIVPVKKREGNPYPERISVGRAPNCDVVLRLPSISKVHAHILGRDTESFTLVDNDAANATFVNGRKVESKTPTPIRVGDVIAFASLEVEFVDANRLYDILRSEFEAKN